MNTRFILGIGIALILIVAGVVLLLTRTPAPSAQTSQNPFASTTSGVGTTDANLSIQARDGSSVVVPNFTKGREPLSASSDTYYDLVHTGPVFGNENDTFGVQYQASNSYFLVSLLAEPLGQSRQQAESFLKKTLQLSDTQMCALNIQVHVTQDINAQYSDKGNLGLSFCPGAVELPY